ncbi:MAG: DEAD/DEAH box helicase [Gemmatimonadetes bacterium]|jgi:ATP-dependent RNA helicase DeaD|nr:DEAD/DEAH box helicase [Gemmatimonadota bacterium]
MIARLLPNFEKFSLPQPLLKALDDVGYETPTPIQEQTIPHVLAGRDLLGQAQTGTGKTAAFALPLLARIDFKRRDVQVLVLTPTRELAIQVAEAFQRYAAHLKRFHVLPIYGGQAYEGQLRQLKRGPQVVVGTPGRVMDHMRRGTLRLDGLDCLVLDEADEMLRMGFIDDVKWVLERTPDQRQIALFSATMPAVIRQIAAQHLNDPQHIIIKERLAAAATINQRYWMGGGHQKLDALTRILESEPSDGVLVFVRTRTATVELAEKLEARGYSSAPLNGDIPQKRRESTVAQLKKGKFDILVATDVAARGLDIDRISHVINYDIPHDTEAYIHRIGRTGRAGRSGEAILFVAPRERRMLYSIERATQQKIQMMEMPSAAVINEQRIARFKQSITQVLATEELESFRQLLEQYQHEHGVPPLDIAAALAKMAQGEEPLLLPDERKKPQPQTAAANTRQERAPLKKERRTREETPQHKNPPSERPLAPPPEGMERFRLEVGRAHDVKPGHIVGTLASEAMLGSDFIGRIEIYDDYSTVDLPQGMPRDLLRVLKKAQVVGRYLRISRLAEGGMREGKKFRRQGGHKKKGMGKAGKTGRKRHARMV